MPRIDATRREVSPGYWVTAPTVEGDIEAHPGAPQGTRAPTIEQPTGALVDALDAAEMREIQLLEVRARTVRGGGPTRGAPPADAEDVVTLDVPDLGDTVGQVVMAVHPGGAVTWHRPVASTGAGSPGGPPDSTRGGSASTTFRIRLPEAGAVPTGADAPAGGDGTGDGEGGGDDTTRGLMGMVGSTLLKVFVFPVAQRIAGRAVQSLAGRWETSKRPPRLRWYGPGADRREGAEVDSEGLARLREGRGLLLVHGTFSTAVAGFGQLPNDLVGELQHAYGGRMVALEHPSMSVSPVDNIDWLSERLGDGPALDLDVLTHSRGGLVGRVLAGQAGPVRGVEVGTLVYGATPNHGTPLADPGHVGEFLDRHTSLLNLFPAGPTEVVATVLEALLTAVKATVVGGIATLPGINAMDPNSEWLGGLAPAPGSKVVQRAIAADFEPTGALAVSFKHRAKDAVVDRVMGPVANDLVVPTIGVSGTDADPVSIAADPLTFGVEDGVHHSSIFSQPRTHAALREWLSP